MQNIKKEEKLLILFDASTLASGVYNNTYRTGIFMVAYNIFNQLLNEPGVSLSLYCQAQHYDDLCLFLKRTYPNYNFDIKTDIVYSKFVRKFYDLKQTLSKMKANNNKFKSLLRLFLLPYSILIKIVRFITLKSINFGEYDAFFSPFGGISKLISNKSIKKYTFLHDTIPVLFQDITKGAIKKGKWFRNITDSFSKDDYYFANSESTKNDFLKYYSDKLDESHVKTILLACDKKFQPQDDKKVYTAKQKYNIPANKKYVFSLCTLDPRKNLIRSVKTFIQFIQKNNIEDLVFVLGGASWEVFLKKLKQEINLLGEYKDKIIRIGYVDDKDLAPLYSGAEWFVYTSQYEGFGLPPLEAMSCGCPVITSNNSSLPEVVGDAGIMIDFDSDEQHIEAYRKYYYNQELRTINAKKGLERAKQFSWEKSTKQIVNCIKENK